MEGNKVDAIFNELEQICSQYKEEFPGRRAWPKAIKERIIQLRKLGAPESKIADQFVIPYMTILLWQPKVRSNFIPVSVTE